MVRTVSPGTEQGTSQPDVTYYCAYFTSRGYAARHRNRSNCRDCKQGHTKCNGSDGIACDRCVRLGKHCSLLESVTQASDRRSQSSSPPVNEDEQRFGRVLYVMPYNGGAFLDVFHVRAGVDGHEQVYRSQVDQNWMPIAATDYVGPLVEFLNRFAVAVATVNVQGILEALS